MAIIPLELAGRCRSGSDSGGIRAHAVSVPDERLASPNVAYFGGKALCGAAPKGSSVGWSSQIRTEVTCPRCLKKMGASK